MPDLDDAGREHERQVVASLRGRAKSLRVLRLPIPEPSKGCNDLSDWIDQCGGTAEELRKLIDAAPEPQAIVSEATAAKDPVLAELEERYFVARHGGKVLIAYEDEIRSSSARRCTSSTRAACGCSTRTGPSRPRTAKCRRWGRG